MQNLGFGLGSCDKGSGRWRGGSLSKYNSTVIHSLYSKPNYCLDLEFGLSNSRVAVFTSLPLTNLKWCCQLRITSLCKSPIILGTDVTRFFVHWSHSPRQLPQYFPAAYFFSLHQSTYARN